MDGEFTTVERTSGKNGIATVLPSSKLSSTIDFSRKIHYLKPYRYRNQLILSELLNKKTNEILNGYSIELTKVAVDMRLIKSKEELIELENAGKIGYAMHIVAMKMCQPGVSEQEIAETIERLAIAEGNRVSFPTILSMNGQTLHNHDHSGILTSGRLMLCDAGAENNHFSASVNA